MRDPRRYGATVIENQHTSEWERLLALRSTMCAVIDDFGIDSAELTIRWTWSRRFAAGFRETTVEHVLSLEASLPG